MVDIVLEVLRAIIVGTVLLFFIRQGKWSSLRTVDGWQYIIAGFMLVFLGMVVDITDNFESLNRFVVIGDTEVESFVEKVVGYLVGFLLLAIGFSRWLPKVVEHERQIRAQLLQAEETVERLQGLLPICATCKKIRDKQGSWHNVESYIESLTEVDFTHGICPDCLKKVYSDLGVHPGMKSAQQ
ncbi:MAG: hypothetical protein OEY01_15660 [Desulfobulbaceae bacterium]|nr:hypothetical protein [Desulfobulbaceae bacterium]